jgi:Family of unknown function (DUF6678)
MFDRTRYSGYANDTKWSELQRAMVCLYPRAPCFRVKTLNWQGELQWDGEWYHHFRLDYEWREMEWVDLKPQALMGAISLDEIEAMCRGIGFEIERHKDFIRIIGYRRMR